MTMEKHIQVLGILHIVYSAAGLLVGVILFLLFIGLGTFIGSFHDVPGNVHDGVPAVLYVIGLFIGTLLFLFSIPGIIGGVGILYKKEWARILTLVVGFFDLLHIPVGTALGVYTIWVLMNDQTLTLFRKPAQ
jgi:hypothetical protein